jgi:hypothetical protein
MTLENIYAEYAAYIIETTGCSPLTWEDWNAIEESDRPGMDIYGDKEGNGHKAIA